VRNAGLSGVDQYEPSDDVDPWQEFDRPF
jgi:hypothetical protein